MRNISFLFLIGLVLFPGLSFADYYCFKLKTSSDPILLEHCLEEKECPYCDMAIKCYDQEKGEYERQEFVEKNRKNWEKIKEGEKGCAAPKRIGKNIVRGDSPDVPADQPKTSK